MKQDLVIKRDGTTSFDCTYTIELLKNAIDTNFLKNDLLLFPILYAKIYFKAFILNSKE